MSIADRIKYRPYISATELLELVRVLETQHADNQILKPLLTNLDVMVYKIRKEMIAPSHTNTPTIKEKLGFEDTGVISPIFIPEKSKEIMIQKLNYDKWRLVPEVCTHQEKKSALEYGSTRNLLSQDETNLWEELVFEGLTPSPLPLDPGTIVLGGDDFKPKE